MVFSMPYMIEPSAMLQAVTTAAMRRFLYQLWLGAAPVAKLRKDGSTRAHAMSVTTCMLRALFKQQILR